MNDHETQSWITSCEHEHDPAQKYYDGDDESNAAISRRSSSICEIEEEEEDEEEDATSSIGIGIGSSSSGIPVHHQVRKLLEGKRYFPMQSIKEEQQSSPNYNDNSYNYGSGGDDLVDCVYVAVGKSESSMDALKYAVKQVLSSSSNANSTILYLIHVFSEIKYIPSPLGKLPKSRVSSEQVESYMAQESGKRRQLLQKFLDTCSQAQVTVDTLLIESDMIGKAIVDLIPILNIRKLVLGTNKNNLRKLISRRGNGIADHILQSAPEGCDIKIICEGNEVMVNDSLSSPRSISNNSDDNSKPNTLSPRRNDKDPKFIVAQEQSDEAVSCMCFKPKRSF